MPLSSCCAEATHCSASNSGRAPFPQLAEDASDAAAASAGGPDAPAAAPSAHFEDAVLHNSADFYKWHSELEATRTSETEEKFRRYAATLQGYLDACNELLGKVLAPQTS